jgi:signal transduction histidine kinase
VTRPISDLVHAARAIGGRDLHYRVKSEGSQEQQDLAQSFNRMAEELERAETVRRNLMADVAHELRTPLTILDGNLRAMLDGVRPLDEAGIAALMEETHHLNRLVEDLRLLSQRPRSSPSSGHRWIWRIWFRRPSPTSPRWPGNKAWS